MSSPKPSVTPLHPAPSPGFSHPTSAQGDASVLGEMATRIRQFDWSTTPLGPSSQWPSHLAATVDLMLGHGFPMIVLWGPELIQLYNDSYAEVMGDKHPEGLGMPTRECWPEVWQINGPIYDRVWQGETLTYADKLYPLARRNGQVENTWLTLTYNPLRGPDGRIDGVLVTLFETTAAHLARAERERAERERRESEERLALAFQVLPVGVCLVDLEGRVQMANEVMRSYLPGPLASLQDPGNTARWQGFDEEGQLLAPDQFPAARALRGETVVPGREFLHLHEDGRQSWTRVASAPLRDASGEVTAVFSTVVDIDGLKRSAEALRANEERFQQFAAASSDVLWIREAQLFDAEMVTAGFDTMFGLPREEVMGPLRAWASLVVPEDRDALFEHLEQVRNGQSGVLEYRIQRRSDGVFRWIRDTAFPLYDGDGQLSRVAGIASDITETRRLAEHQGVLVAELQHRVRNLMAMISSIVWRTQATVDSVSDYAQRLSGRLMSLARTQALLTRAANVGVDLRKLVEEELAAVAPQPGAFSLEGPEVTMPPKAAEVLSLALHELAINALKHGAFARADGHVTVRWTRELQAEQPWLRLHWDERHPPVPGSTPPARRGFGSALVEERVPYELAGQGRIEHGPGGVSALIAFPLRGRDSILQTDAPRQAGIHGGELDLGGEVQWQGLNVLVVDDDYYQAQDLATALRSTGATVVGPYGDLAQTRQALDRHRPDMAVVDVNLGQGATGELMTALAATGIPFVVVTGYDASALPVGVHPRWRLQKPVSPREVLRALAGAWDEALAEAPHTLL